MRRLRFIGPLFILACIANSTAWAEDDAAANKRPDPAKTPTRLQVGTVDFVSGPESGHNGCPTVMCHNREQRMLLVLTSQLDDALGQLAAAAQGVDGKTTHGHLVLLPGANASCVDESKLADQLKKWGEGKHFDHFTLGVRRDSKDATFKHNGIPADVDYAIYLLDSGDTVQKWHLKAGELSAEKIEQIAASVKKPVKPT